jgi:hypothetical protein
VDSQSVPEIKHKLLKLYDAYLDGTLRDQFHCKNIEQFSRQNLTRKLVGEFESLLNAESKGAKQ